MAKKKFTAIEEIGPSRRYEKMQCISACCKRPAARHGLCLPHHGEYRVMPAFKAKANTSEARVSA